MVFTIKKLVAIERCGNRFSRTFSMYGWYVGCGEYVFKGLFKKTGGRKALKIGLELETGGREALPYRISRKN